MLEKEIEKRVCEYARKTYGVLTYKFTSPARRNVPDRMFLFPGGRVLFIEFKQLGKGLTAGQARECNRLRNQGFYVAVIDDVEFGKSFVDYFESASVSGGGL